MGVRQRQGRQTMESAPWGAVSRTSEQALGLDGSCDCPLPQFLHLEKGAAPGLLPRADVGLAKRAVIQEGKRFCCREDGVLS